MHRGFFIVCCWVTLPFLYVAQADTLEQTLARHFIRSYKQGEARLATIEQDLKSLPQPYLQEPTGSGGFLSHGQNSATNEVILTFNWDEPVELDAVALFPLRLFTDEIYDNNLYWPGSVTIEVEINGQLQPIAQGSEKQPIVRQSLPELITFQPVTTRKLLIRCSDLPQHPYEKWYAAGFAEICIFSNVDNVAPRANCTANTSRQGYYVLAKEFLTDAQTPLGIPELSSHANPHGFIKKFGLERKSIPYILTLIYPQKISVDAIRIDPAIQHSYGQGFPVRFTIDLLDAQGNVLQTDDTYKKFSLRNPGLNPYFSYLPETEAQAIRLTVLEAYQPNIKATPTIAFSEITPLHKGAAQIRPAIIEELFRGKTLRIATDEPLDTHAKRMLAPANDGLTHSGRVLLLRQWITGLVQRQQLMEEQIRLRDTQKHVETNAAKTLIYGSLIILVSGLGIATYFVVRHRIRMHKEFRTARAKIASDLHDDVGSNLGTIILHVERLQEHAAPPEEQTRLAAIYRLTRESVFGLREVLSTTAPEVGRTQDIVTYMHELAGLILGKTPYTFQTDPAMSEQLSESALRKGLLLFYKEALYNAKRHANCNQVEISLHHRNKVIILQIKDDGKGIDETILKKARTLRTLKQRADWLHADLSIESSLEAGTTLTLSIPHRLGS